MLGLCIVYFKRYDTCHDTHEAIFDMYQHYVLSGFMPKSHCAECTAERRRM